MAKSDPDCIFCKIVAGEIPSEKVFENDHVLAFMDINPTSRGHTLVIPKDHSENLVSTDVNMLLQVTAALPKIAAAAVKAVGAQGFNVLQSNSPCAGQVVPHIHFHIVPRNDGDGIGLGFRQRPPVGDELGKTAEAIRAALY
ncbi:MAG: HIT family protein [Planctomycetota bacterium]